MTTSEKIWSILTENGGRYDDLSQIEIKKLHNDIYYVIRRLQLDHILDKEKNSGNVRSLTLFRLTSKKHKMPQIIINPF